MFQCFRLILDNKLAILVVLLASAILTQMPSWMQYMAVGAAISAMLFAFVPLLFRRRYRRLITLHDLRSLFSPFTKAKSDDTYEEEDEFKGWFNEVDNYDPEAKTKRKYRSVFVRLKRFELSLSTAKRRLPKQAIWDEDLPSVPRFVDHRQYNVLGADVYLLPADMKRAYQWGRRKPICIRLWAESNYSEPNKAETIVYLFARCSRDKETWYRLLVAAAAGTPMTRGPCCLLPIAESQCGPEQGGPPPGSAAHRRSAAERKTITNRLDSYLAFMDQALPTDTWRNRTLLGIRTGAELAWINTIVMRFSWDFLFAGHKREAIWAMLQKICDNIQLASFLGPLVVTQVDLGKGVPVILRASRPFLDSRGLWADVDISYSGGFSMTIESKCLWTKKSEMRPEPTKAASKQSDSEEEELDEDDEEEGRKKSKFSLKNYLYKATQTSYLKRALSDLSTVGLELSLSHFSGRLAINIPQPPTNTLWYGFRSKPSIDLRTEPCLADKNIKIGFIVDRIERMFTDEFVRLYVMPNMQNIVIPAMSDEPSPIIGEP